MSLFRKQIGNLVITLQQTKTHQDTKAVPNYNNRLEAVLATKA